MARTARPERTTAKETRAALQPGERPPEPARPAATAEWTLARLRGRYGALPFRPHGDPISELVLTILSQHTNDTNSGGAFAELQRRYPSWDAVVSAESAALIETIRSGGLANQKGPRIQSVLRRIQAERGEWSLQFLETMPLAEAKTWLRTLPGVGAKTAACVLLFALGRPALPVDTHVYRVCRRLGLIDERMSAEDAHDALEALVEPNDIYAFHIALIKHGRHTCTARTPNCGGCPLNDRCPSASIR